MRVVVIERAGGGWRYGWEDPDGDVRWVGTARERADEGGHELDGAPELAPTVLLLLRANRGQDRIRYELDAERWRASTAPPPAADPHPYQRANAGRSKGGTGETLGDRARRQAGQGSGPPGPPPSSR